MIRSVLTTLTLLVRSVIFLQYSGETFELKVAA